MNFSYFSYSTIIIVNLLLGCFVYFRNPKSKINQYYALFVASIVGWIITLFLYYYFTSHDLVLIIGKINFAVALFIPFFFYRFIYFFPSEFFPIPRIYKFFLLLFTVIITFLTLFTPLVDQDELVKGKERATIFGILYPLYIINFLGTTLFSIYLLFIKLKRSRGLFRVQLQYLLFAFTLFITFGTITNIIFPYFLGLVYLEFFAPIFSLFLVGLTTLAIIRHRFLNIRLIIARSIAYLILVVIIAVFYTVDIFLISNLFFNLNINTIQIATYVILTLFIAFTFQPLKIFMEDATDSIFFKGKYDSNELIFDLTKIMATTLNLDQMIQQTLSKLLSTLRIHKGAFILFREKDKLIILQSGYKEQPNFDNEKVLHLAKLKRILIYDEEEDEQIRQSMRKLDIVAALPLLKEEHEEGLLILGEKASGELYSTQDINFLKIFGPEISIAIRNAKSYEEIQKFNITLHQEVNRATKELQDKNERLKQLDRLKNDFVSVASHELRTPMTAIKSYLWMALDGQGGALNDKQKYYVDRAYTSVERLIKLVNDMLNISRIESGRLTVEMSSVNIIQLVKEVIEEISPRAKELGINLNIETADNIPLVMADANKIKEVIYNLIGNSMKFSRSGDKIMVSINKKEAMVELSVKDMGAGIASEDLPKLFQKFGILPGSYVTNQPALGTGLGLYICRSLIELHGGKIWATSEGKGKGSTFTFALKEFNQYDLQEYNKKHKQPETKMELISSKIL